MRWLSLVTVSLLSGAVLSPAAFAADTPTDLSLLQSQGFVISHKTRLKGVFAGCDAGQTYALDNGKSFTCDPVEKSKKPEFVILTHPKTGEQRFLIQGDEFDGEIED